MVGPLLLNLFLEYKKSKRDTTKDKGILVGSHGLYRTLMTFGIILLVGTVIFYLLALITLNMSNPTNPILQSLIDVLKNLSTILGTALATIVAFYFGVRAAESSAEKTETNAGEFVEKITPAIVGTTPEDGENRVAINSPVTVTFDVPMLASTINNNTFSVKKEGTTSNIDGKISLSSDGKTTIFDPTNDFDSATKYIVIINTEIKNLAGNALGSSKSWSFTTV
jgi:hypothetical protein